MNVEVIKNFNTEMRAVHLRHKYAFFSLNPGGAFEIASFAANVKNLKIIILKREMSTPSRKQIVFLFMIFLYLRAKLFVSVFT